MTVMTSATHGAAACTLMLTSQAPPAVCAATPQFHTSRCLSSVRLYFQFIAGSLSQMRPSLTSVASHCHAVVLVLLLLSSCSLVSLGQAPAAAAPSARSGSGCTSLPTPPANGSMTASSDGYQTTYTFSCNPGYLLSGTPSVTCTYTQWTVNTAACISIQAGGGCTTRKVSSAALLQCQPNEMVVSGTVDCGSTGAVLGSKPMPNMQSWYGLCAATTGDASVVPVTITASCCQIAADTFNRPPAGQLPNPSQLPILPARSFLQNCEYQQGDSNSQVYFGNYYWGLSCPAGKSAIAGGLINPDTNVAPTQWFATLVPTTGLFEQVPPLFWSAGGTNIGGYQSPPLEISAMCCSMVSGSLSSFHFAAVSTQLKVTSTAVSSVSCSANAFATGAGVNVYWYAPGGYSEFQESVNCIPTAEPSTTSPQMPSTVTYCPVPSATTGTLTLTPTVAAGSQEIPVKTVATLSCDSYHYLVGASSASCLPSGQWSQPLGTCNSIDQTSCFTVENTAITSQSDSGITVQCPSGGSSSYIMISGGVSCDHTPYDNGNSAFVTIDLPTSLTSRKGGCNSNGAYPVFTTVYGTCCLTTADPLFTTCTYQSSNSFASLNQGNYANMDCGDGNFALAGGAQCSNYNQYSTYNTLLVSTPSQFLPYGASTTPASVNALMSSLPVYSRYWSTMCTNPYNNGIWATPWTSASAICCSAQGIQAALLSKCLVSSNYITYGYGPRLCVRSRLLSCQLYDAQQRTERTDDQHHSRKCVRNAQEQCGSDRIALATDVDCLQ